MAPRRGASSNSLSPLDFAPTPSGGSSPASANSTRSVSPSAGFSQFLAKPTRWFSRSSSGGGSGPGRSSISSNEPRSSTSSTGRKPKISHPTDPRPILDNLLAEKSNVSASRSVLDLSLSRNTPSMDDPGRGATPRTPFSANSGSPRGMGDLRNLARKPWSRSADDLGKFSSSAPSPALTPIDMTFNDRLERYRTGRNDSFGSTNNVPSPSSSIGSVQMPKTLPFPTITTSEPLSSSPPQQYGLQPPASPSQTPPALTPSGSSTSNGHVHARSHSFTPRLPSKLAGAKGLVPPTPVRKGSAPTEGEPERQREKTTSGGSTGSSSSARSPFPFGLGAGSGSGGKGSSPLNTALVAERGGGSAAAATPMMLSPPTIVEPDSAKQDKRTSQVVYHAGFINRLVAFSPAETNVRATQAFVSGGAGAGGAAVQTLAKGWKPFKLVLKGSKLYFYKPPSDRGAAVKELFPTELVALLEDEGLSEELEPTGNDGEVEHGRGRGGKGKEREEMRKRRAYWGRGTHPSLVVASDHRIDNGTFEALVHECIFATTFLLSELPPAASPNDVAEGKEDGMTQEPTSEQKDAVSTSRYQPRWRDFSSAIILALPFFVGRPKFEAEFTRCCTSLISGAADDMKEEEVNRAGWLVSQYLNYHGSPANADSWDSWLKDTLPDFIPNAGVDSRLSGLPQSTSLEGLYTSSPYAPQAEFSPNIGTFSPRPADDSKILSIVEALGVPLAAGAVTSPPAVNARSIRTVLERVGLTKSAIMGLDAQLLAQSLSVFHKRLLKQVPDNFPAELCLGNQSETAPDATSALPDAPATPSPPSGLAAFSSCEEQPHWLTRLVLIQILVADPGSSLSHGGPNTPIGDDRQNQPARTHSRSDIISTWARIGELCRRTGDECSWRAIFAALCSRPVARLDKIWKRVDAEALAFVQAWVQPDEHGDDMSAGLPLVVPWAGDTISQIKDLLEAASVGDGDEWQAAPLLQACQKFEGLRTAYALCTRRREPDVSAVDDVEALAEQWQMLSEGKSPHPLASKFVRIDQFMSLSFAAEPRRRGLFEPYYWTRPPMQLSYHPLSALLFPEPLPTVSFINRELATRGRLESNASSLNVQDLQNLRETWRRSGVEGLQQPDAPKPGGLDLGGTMLPIFDGELILLVQPGSDQGALSRAASRSRPPSSNADTNSISTVGEKTFSRNPSIRVKPGSSHGIDRKPSMARRNSLPSLSHRASLAMPDVSSERPLRVVVQAGTLDRLVDILAHGLQGVSVSVADDNGEMPLNDKKTREVRVDLDDFADVWWNTFRSFVTPAVLFELLRKRYLSARLSQAPSAVEVARVVRVRSEILEALLEWVDRGGGAQDALDDVQLYSSLEAFLKHPTDHDLAHRDDPDVCKASITLEQIRQNLHRSFLSKTKRPSQPVSDNLASGQLSRNFGPEPPDVDRLDAEDLVNNLDAMALAAFQNVVQEDLFMTADLLEVQSADRTGWFLPREPSSISDEVEIQFMSSYIVEVEPSPMISELGQDTLYRLLPPSIRSCIRAFGLLRKWLVSKLVAYRLGLHSRHARMELMLRAIEVCRLRTGESGSPDLPYTERPCVRSFVEAVLTSAILSVESRSYHRAWQAVALARRTPCDSVASLLSKPTISSVATRRAMTVDVGWLLEKMLEIISTPDILEASQQESLSLVNFDKRRSLHALVNNPSWVTGGRKARSRRSADRSDFERLNNIEKELNGMHFDLRGIREEAHREAAQVQTPVKKHTRPFHALVALQQDKIKRDRYLRERLVREKRAEQQRNDRRDEVLNKAMNPRKPLASVQKQHRNKKSMSSAFFQFMRPISSAFSSESLAMPGVKRTPAELDFIPSQKPSLVLSVVDAHVSQFVNNERSFTFQLDTEDGGHYLLQALGKQEMKKWIDTIQHVSKTTAKRRLTYLGQDSKMQLSDHLLSPLTASRDPRAVFGVELDILLQREAEDGEVQLGAIPSVLEKLIAEVESRGLTEMGIYRIAGAHSEVNAFKDALNRGEWPITTITDIHAVCDLIKSWFRVLPGGIFPTQLYSRILEAATPDGDLESRLSNIRQVIHDLPDKNFDLLKRIIEHLERVTDYEENNQMTAESLATVFSPNILRPPGNDIGTFFANMSAAHRVTKTLIAHVHMIFDTEVDQDPEVDQDQEQDEYEYEDPILEEDENEEEDESFVETESPEGVEMLKVSVDPPQLDINLGSPASFSFSMNSVS